MYSADSCDNPDSWGCPQNFGLDFSSLMATLFKSASSAQVVTQLYREYTRTSIFFKAKFCWVFFFISS